MELPDGSYLMSDIQGYIKYMIKKRETLSGNTPIHIYINSMNNRLVFKIKNGYKLELQTPEKIKFFGSTKKLTEKTRNWKNLEVLELV